MDVAGWIFVVGLALIGLVFGATGYISERQAWNGGICRISNCPWKHFGTDSWFGRGYKDGQGNYTWISWPGIDKGKG